MEAQYPIIGSLSQKERMAASLKSLQKFDLRLLPAGLSVLFLAIQLLNALIGGIKSIRRQTVQRNESHSDSPSLPSDGSAHEGLAQKLKSLPQACGGHTVFGFMVARLAGSFTLLYLSTITSLQECQGELVEPFTACPQFWMTASFAYATSLALATLFTPRKAAWTARFHVVVLLSALGVYLYRDIWPLATYNSEPADQHEGSLLWAKLAVLTATAVIIPLFMPRQYVPVDPKDPAIPPNPEQTASWFSLLTYSYLDPLIILANKVAHLAYDQLPPLADYDRSRYLTDRAFPYLDAFSGAKRRHLFFGFLLYFRPETIKMLMLLTFHALLNFVAPIGINRTLAYLETQGSDASVKPWVWVIFMFAGPTSLSIVEHRYLFVQVKIRVRIQALITQLVFQHSLRIRLKAEGTADATEGTQSPPISREDRREESLHDADSSILLDSSSTSAGSQPGDGTDSEESNRTASTSTVTGKVREPSAASTLQSSLKGKSKTPQADSATPSAKTSLKNADNLIGKINNLVTTDLDNIQEGADFLALMYYAPLQVILSMAFLYRILGWSAMVGLAMTVILSPIVGYLGKLTQDVQSIKMKSTDARVQEISEAVGVIRMIKLFGWERKMARRLDHKRREELQWLWKLKYLKTSNELFSLFIPSLTMVSTYATYTVIMKQELTASTIFSSMAVFSILREQLHRVSWQYNLLVDAKVSLDRVNEYMRTTELLDRFATPEASVNGAILPAIESISGGSELGFRNATFAWSVEEEDGTLTPSSRKFRLHIDGELLFKRNCINLIIGPTGSGKTSVLMALLGEMHFIPSRADSWFNLPRQGGVAYAAQESWVQNATIRDNIVFGSVYDEERYQKVIHQCALEHDLELFEAGDKTEVGERGLTLSGGQKARITLARAIYSPAEIILLDDVLAALDVHTSAWIVDKCFRGDLVKGRTILLVTHNVKLASPVAHFVVSLGLDGSINSQGYEVDTALKSDPLLAAEVRREETVAAGKEADPTPEKPSDGKLIVAEEIVQGHITWRSMKLLFKGLGGRHYILFAALWALSMFMEEGLFTLQTWFLGVWGSQYETRDPSEVDLGYYISVFSLLLVAHIVFWAAVQLYYFYRTIRASRVIHAELVDSVFGSTLRWLDETPTARIIARCTQDIRTVDGPIMQNFVWVSNQAAGMLTKLAVIVLFTPVFVVPGIAVAVVGVLLGKAYLKAQLSIKREMSNARSPLLAHFSAAMHGLVSIRAYGAQKAFSEESLKRIDFYCRAAAISFNVNRWIGHRIDVLGATFTSALAFYLIYGSNVGAANTGFSLNMAVSFCIYIFWVIRIYNEFEVQSNSLERIQGYIDIDHEPKATEAGEPPAAWPTSGDLRVENLSARYSQTGPRVLHNLSFHIPPGQRVGIVGRTGSGKSSLTLALLRCIITEGTVYYDGLPTNTINLDALRSSITIIPQTPELLSGTLRQNLDPFDQHNDATLNDALRAAGLFSLQEDAGEIRLTLDSKIAGGGGNLSVGQRQIIALARAIVRGSKLLILDEATSAIDYKTDAVIQRTLRNQLSSDVTVLTVAHRLQTIMDADKIMVLENGRIAEFDSPKVLIRKEKGIFKALVDESGDRELLYALADSNRMASGSPDQARIHRLSSQSANLTNHSPNDVRRIFVGPMPERVIALSEAKAAQGKKVKLTIGSALSLGSHVEPARPESSDRNEEVAKALREQAFQFFLHHGGKAEDWGEENEDGLVEELTHRWKDSEWGQLWERRHRRKKGLKGDLSSTHWFGTSFEVGNLLGMNVMNGQEHVTNKSIPSSRKSQSSVIDETEWASSVAPTSRTGLQTFTTAPSTFGTAKTQHLDLDNSRTRPSHDFLEVPDIPPSPASSRTGLLVSRRIGAAPTNASLTTNHGATENAEPVSANVKGKAKMVHYADLQQDQGPVSTPGPVSPEAVLERTHSTVDQNTSMAATIPDEASIVDTPEELNWGEVVLRDRMLVRANFTKADTLPYFTDEVNRTTRNLHFEDWGEFLVAWRRDAIEIYRDHHTFGSCKDWVVGHKHLSYVIPLKSSRTHLSLYSFVDLTFCITCAPTTTRLNSTASRWIFSKEKEGTNIFIFKVKSRSRAYDWCWHLWRQLGGKIPRSIDIHSPRLNTKVTIDVPANEDTQNGSLYRVYKRENLLNLCMSALRKVPDWDYLMESEIAKGKSLQLDWRVDANLDWIWQETDISDKPRDWAVLSGLPFKHSPKHPVLEVRLAEHRPTYIHLKNGRRIDEPPAIEGFVDRIRPSTQTRQQIYLSTHNGYLFTLDPLSAFPPMPPGLAPIADVYADAQALRQAEIGRGINQIISATGVCDLKTIVAVRRASHPSPSPMHDVKETSHEDPAWLSVWESPEERDGEDEGDEGGEAALNKQGDRTRLRIKRSFELLLKTGHVVRFEAHSCQVALEWVERLRALIVYWKSRHRHDAKQEIELAQAQRPRLTPQTRVYEDEHEYPPEAPPDPSTTYGAIDRLYNWCVLEGCRPITKGGRIYMKKGLHGQYQLMQLFLVAGHLVSFRVGPSSSLYPAVRKKVNLLDAYVCSGFFAAQTLPKGQYLPNADLVPRRYQDGLETDDREEDMLFMIWYRPHSQMASAAQDPTTTPLDVKTPSLSAKNKLLVFKARSILERDSWCWALNSEIEKIVRAQQKREEKLRETGNLVELK